MWDSLVGIIAKVYASTVILDDKIYTFYMKLTGKGRASFMYVVLGIYVGYWIVRSVIDPYNIIFMAMLGTIYTFWTIQYHRWLKNPGSNLATVEVKGDRFYNCTAISAFCFITIWNVLCMVLFSFIIFKDPLVYVRLMATTLLLEFYFGAITHSGPKKPDNTFWQQAKSKVKSLIEANRRPVLQPIPLGR